MSGIAGIVHFDGRPVRRTQVQGMVDAMAHRGPDGHDVYVEGAVGLGHARLHTTPESLTEVLPRTSRAGLSITADARIDNRDDLIAALRLPRGIAPYSDSDLILHTIERWGAEGWDRLEGDFAVALYDHSEQRLVLGCDVFAVRQLYYAAGPNFLAFASEIKALRTLPYVSDEIDDEAIVEFFVPELVSAERTIYRSIRRLLPGHTLMATHDGVQIERYTDLQASTVPQNRSNEWYAEAFGAQFQEAVRCRLRSAGPVGSELSGGLDSSFVTCTASALLREQGGSRLHTFSNVYEHVPQCDERAFIDLVVKQEAVCPHYTVADERSMDDLLPEILSFIDDGRVVGNHHLIWLSATSAGQAGVRVLLTGQDGDSTVGHGLELFNEWVHAGDWARFGREARRYVGVLNAEVPTYARNPGFPVRMRDVVNSFAAESLLDWTRNGRYLHLLRAMWTAK